MKKKIIAIPKNKLVFGTAQFFKNYGIIKKKNDNALELLNTAFKSGCRYFDTSDLYGKSYKIIEKNQKNLNLIIKLSTKKNNKFISLRDFEKKIQKIFNEIKKNNIYGLLIHDFNIKFAEKYDDYFIRLINLCKKKRIKIGFSIYNIKEFNFLKKKFKFNLIQIPINVFNREFLNSDFKKFVRQKKIEIHIRSIFLQGLLINDLKYIPNKFKIYKKYFLRWKNFCEKLDIHKIEGCLNFLSKQKLNSKYVIGFKSKNELLELLNLKLTKKIINYNEFKKIPLLLKSPNLWNKL